MKLVQPVKDTRMFVSGYEHHTWQCSVCPAVERRMTFAGENAPSTQSDARKSAPFILCLDCGSEMTLVQVAQDTAMLVPGYEHHTWRCSHCSRVEKRMKFTRTPTQVPVMQAPVAVELIETAAEAMQTVPGDLIPVGMLQTAAVATSHQEPTGAMRRSALAEKLRGLKERSAAGDAHKQRPLRGPGIERYSKYQRGARKGAGEEVLVGLRRHCA
jgi:hypothetical protein